MNAIVAVDHNWGIGRNNELLFHIPADLRRFKEMTIGGTVILGRRTMESLPGGRPLPERRSIVLSRQPGYRVEGAEVCRSLDELSPHLRGSSPRRVFVIGGAQVYRALLPKCRCVYVTRVESELAADVFFPDLDEAPGWDKVETGPSMEYMGLSFRYEVYESNR